MRPTSPRSHHGTGARGGRLVVAVALAAMGWAAMGPSSSGAAEPESAAAAHRLVVITEGDTLWDLARSHAPEGMSRREWIADVTDRNGVDPREVRPGDALRVPVD